MMKQILFFHFILLIFFGANFVLPAQADSLAAAPTPATAAEAAKASAAAVDAALSPAESTANQTLATQTTDGGKKFTWEQCLQTSIAHSDDLRSAQDSLQASIYSQKASYSDYFPQIAGSVNYTYSGTNNNASGSTVTSNGATSIIAPISTGNTSTYSTALTASENLFSGLSDQGKIDQTKANEQLAGATLRSVKANVSYNLKVAFAGLIYAQNSIKIDQEIIKHREDNLRMIELRFESGEENKGSVMLTKANLEQAKFTLLQAVDNVDTAKAALAKAMGLDDYDDLGIMGTVPVVTPPTRLDYKCLALGAPDYLQSLAQENVADAGVTIARSGFFPTLSLTGSLANSGDSWFPANQRWAVGAGITFPLFNGGRDFYGTKGALQSLSAALYTKQSTYKQDISKLKTAYTNYIEAVQKLEVDRLYDQAAIVRDKIGREQYNNGLINFDDFDIIETDYITRETNLLQSEQNRIVEEAAWEQAQGKGAIP
jgi:outer membrane protein